MPVTRPNIKWNFSRETVVETPAPCEFQPDSVSGIKASCDKPVMCGENPINTPCTLLSLPLRKIWGFLNKKHVRKSVCLLLWCWPRERDGGGIKSVYSWREGDGDFSKSPFSFPSEKETKIGRKTTLLFRAMGQPARIKFLVFHVEVNKNMGKKN